MLRNVSNSLRRSVYFPVTFTTSKWAIWRSDGAVSVR